MKYWFDTEFIESGPREPVYLLSIGIVAEDGREFYAVVADAPHEKANDWVKQNVLPHLIPVGGQPHFYAPHGKIGALVREFISSAEKPEFWGYYADYDWVVFCQCFGAMIDLPKGWPMYCRDIPAGTAKRGSSLKASRLITN